MLRAPRTHTHRSRRRRAALALATSAALGITLAPIQAAQAAPRPTEPSAATVAAARPATSAAPTSIDIAEQVRRLPGVVSVEEATAPAGYRFFRIGFRQPVDHHKKHGPTFTQQLTLLHKDTARPMVMYTSGYYVSKNPSRSEPTRITDGNQLSMEYRFFDPSRPAEPNWEKQLTIWQAATDQHRIIRSFQRLYRQNWLTTGGSKGGMTATYHRRFYPDDVDGTVPYVAPNDVVDTRDVYNAFLDRVGNDQGCRDALTGIQRRVLGADRAWFTDRLTEATVENGYTYDITGSQDRALEYAVVDLYFGYWQYQTQAACARIPDPATATNEQVLQFVDATSPLTGYADQEVSYYTPYYFQAAYQMGSPEPYETRLGDLLRYPGGNTAKSFVPADIRPRRFDKRAMPDIDRWVRTKSDEMLFIYGANDPWSAEPFECGRLTKGKGSDKGKGRKTRACARYYVPGGNHGAGISQLPSAERDAATQMVLDWAGLGTSDQASRAIAKNGTPVRRPRLDGKPDYLKYSRSMR